MRTRSALRGVLRCHAAKFYGACAEVAGVFPPFFFLRCALMTQCRARGAPPEASHGEGGRCFGERARVARSAFRWCSPMARSASPTTCATPACCTRLLFRARACAAAARKMRAYRSRAARPRAAGERVPYQAAPAVQCVAPTTTPTLSRGASHC